MEGPRLPPLRISLWEGVDFPPFLFLLFLLLLPREGERAGVSSFPRSLAIDIKSPYTMYSKVASAEILFVSSSSIQWISGGCGEGKGARRKNYKGGRRKGDAGDGT